MNFKNLEKKSTNAIFLFLKMRKNLPQAKFLLFVVVAFFKSGRSVSNHLHFIFIKTTLKTFFFS